MSQFIEQIRTELRTRRYSLYTEKVYLYWVKKFIRFHDLKHPSELHNPDIERFLNHLAANLKVSASTQNQALCALVFMYKHIIKREIIGLNYGYSRQPRRLPTVLNISEVAAIIKHMEGKHRLLTQLLFGAGLRIHEALKLRVKDIDFSQNTIFVFRGKGGKDRYTMLPQNTVNALCEQIKMSEKVHQRDLSEGFGMTSLPPSLIRKYGNAVRDFCWQYIFYSNVRCTHPHDGYICRHHIHQSSYRKKLRAAVLQSGVKKRVTAHTFRHSFATQLLLTGSDIRTVQELLGHNDVKTTEIYTHVVGNRYRNITSPVDQLDL